MMNRSYRSLVLVGLALSTLTACQSFPSAQQATKEPTGQQPSDATHTAEDQATPRGQEGGEAGQEPTGLDGTRGLPSEIIMAPPPAADNSVQLTRAQLRSRVRALADQYRAVMSDAVDEIKRNRTDPELRRLAHQLKIDGATAMYDIAVDPSSRTALLDMLVLITLQSYLANAKASATFPDDHPLVTSKTEQLRTEAWKLASQVMSEKQRGELLEVINRWWADNSTTATDIWYLRISDFAAYSRGTSFEGVIDGVKGIPGNILNAFVPLKDATSTIDEATAIAERATWLAPRQMILAQWRAEAIVLEILAATEVTELLAAVDSFSQTANEITGVAKALPEQVSTTQRELLTGLRENEQTLRNLLDDAQETIARVESLTAQTGSTIGDGEALVKQTEEAIAAIDAVVQSADGLVARLAAMQSEKLQAEAGRQPSEPFEIGAYTEAINALNDVLQETNALVSNVEASTEPSVLEARVQTVRAEGESFVDHVSGQIMRLIVAAGIAIAGAGILIVLVAKMVPSRRVARG